MTENDLRQTIDAMERDNWRPRRIQRQHREEPWWLHAAFFSKTRAPYALAYIIDERGHDECVLASEISLVQ